MSDFETELSDEIDDVELCMECRERNAHRKGLCGACVWKVAF